MPKARPKPLIGALRRAAGVLLFVSLIAPLEAQVGTPEAGRVAAQQRTMDHYEALLARMVAARQRGDCSEFRSINDLEMTDFDADVRSAGLTPEWRRDFESRVDAAGRVACSKATTVAQRQMMNRYEAVLGRMIAAGQREDCRAFREISNIELTDFGADVRSAGLAPEWRRDFESRVDAAETEACTASTNANPSTSSPAEQSRNARFDSQLEILRDAQAQGACGPYQTFQSVLLDEAATMSASERRDLAAVLVKGCTPAAGSPWDPVPPVQLAAASDESVLDELTETVSLLDGEEDPRLVQARIDFAPARIGCDLAAFETARQAYLAEIEGAERRIRGYPPYRDELLREEAAIAVMQRPECTVDARRAARAAFDAGRTSCDRATFERSKAAYAAVIELAIRNVEAAGNYSESPTRLALLREELEVDMTEFKACDQAGIAQSGGSLDWLAGTWRIPHGGAVGFRMEADGTASGFIAETTRALTDNGYAAGLVFLRGCRDVTEANLAVWRFSARCAEGFRDTWQGAGIVLISPGEETLQLPLYIGSPIAGYAKLERVGPPAPASALRQPAPSAAPAIAAPAPMPPPVVTPRETPPSIVDIDWNTTYQDLSRLQAAADLRCPPAPPSKRPKPLKYDRLGNLIMPDNHLTGYPSLRREQHLPGRSAAWDYRFRRRITAGDCDTVFAGRYQSRLVRGKRGLFDTVAVQRKHLRRRAPIVSKRPAR